MFQKMFHLVVLPKPMMHQNQPTAVPSALWFPQNPPGPPRLLTYQTSLYLRPLPIFLRLTQLHCGKLSLIHLDPLMVVLQVCIKISRMRLQPLHHGLLLHLSMMLRLLSGLLLVKPLSMLTNAKLIMIIRQQEAKGPPIRRLLLAKHVTLHQ